MCEEMKRALGDMSGLQVILRVFNQVSGDMSSSREMSKELKRTSGVMFGSLREPWYTYLKKSTAVWERRVSRKNRALVDDEPWEIC